MNLPQLRFPEFKGEWRQIKYGKVFSFRTTNSYSRENLNYDEGTIKNIHYGDIHTKFATLFDITKELVPYINSEIGRGERLDRSEIRNQTTVVASAKWPNHSLNR